MEFQDYYKILGVKRDAGADEVQRAYRKLARKYHPDVNKEESAEDTFKRINEAYEVLKDPEKRKLYDTYGKDWQQGVFHQQAGTAGGFRPSGGPDGFSQSFRYSTGEGFEQSADFSDFFKSFFGGGFRGDQGVNFGYQQPGRSHEAEITVSLRDVYHGASRAISLQHYETDAGGQVRPVTKTLNVKIPKGITDGSVIRLAGQGEQGAGGGAAGDLLLRITINTDPRFTVNGRDLYTKVAISPWEAALGTRVTVQTVEGSVNLTVPKGSQNGRRLRLRGKGIPGRNGDPGDLTVELEIRMPTKLSDEERRLFTELAETSRFNPRDTQPQRGTSHAKS